MTNVIVIGGGPAGVTAALRARELGADVTLIERSRMGGTCTNDGCVPTRVLAKAARLLRDASQFEEYGLYAPEPELDFARLMSRVQRTVYTMHEKKQLIGRLREAGVTVRENAGEAAFLDPHTIGLPDGERLQADRFILAAGGRARRLDFPGAELAWTHADVWQLRKLPRAIAVVGGAATGCQLASIFRIFGSEVTLFEVSPHILMLEDEAVAGVVQEEFVRQGIQIVTGLKGINSIDRSGAGLTLTYKDGAEAVQQLEVDGVILSTGWLGNLDPLRLDLAGVERRGNYVQVDDTLRTTAAHIYAAGDITGRLMLVQTAGSEAMVAVENALLDGDTRNSHTFTPHGGFTDPEYASVGMTEAQAHKAGIEYAAAVVNYRELDRAVIDGHTVGLCKLIVSAENHRLLGVHVAGEQALEVVHMVAAGIAADMWVEQLAELEIAYPTFAAIVGVAARKIVQDLGVRPVAATWRAGGQAPAAEWEKSYSSSASHND